MGCNMDSGALTKEEEDLIKKEEACLLHHRSATELDITFCKYSDSREITESQLAAAIQVIAEQHPTQKRTLQTLLSGLTRPALLTFLILIGEGDSRSKAELLFEVGTDNMTTPELSNAQAEALSDHIITAATETALQLSTSVPMKDYAQHLQRLKPAAKPQLVAKMLSGSAHVSMRQFRRNYGDTRLSTLTGVRRFVIGCGEKGAK